MTWYLAKEWVDPHEGIDGVLIHFTSTPLGVTPQFGDPFVTRVLDDHGGSPRVRRKVLRMPRGVTDGYGNWSPEFTFHYLFEVFESGRSWTTELFSEEVASYDLEFVDDHGHITNICVHWNVDGTPAETYSPMEDPRFPADSEFASVRYYGYDDKPRFHAAKAAMLAEIPLPHRWKSRVWAPRGTQVWHRFHIGHLYPDHERWEVYYGPDGATDDPQSCWPLTLA